MTTSSSSGYGSEPGDDDATETNQRAEASQDAPDPDFVFLTGRPTVSATPVALDPDDDADDDFDDELGGRAALDLDALPRGSGRGRNNRASSAEGGGREPLDLSSLIGEFEAQLQQEQRAKRGPAASEPGQAPAEQTAASGGSAADNQEMARLRAELDAERNTLRRAQADLVNAKRKAEQERARAVQDATERVIRQFFPLFDDFERGLITTRESRSYDQLSSGVEAILRNTDALLARYGVEPTQSIGQLFDPTLHEAIGVVETTDLPEETVVEELRKGYTLDGRLLRAAMVRVARRPAGAEEAAADDMPAPADGEDADAGTDTDLDAAIAPLAEPSP